MMIYRHIPNKEALLDSTVERLRSRMNFENLPDKPAEMLEAIFVEYRRLLAAHPNMIPLATRRTDATGSSGLQFLIDQGLESDDAVELYQSLAAFTIGYAFLGSPLSDSQWSGIPHQVAERLRDWRDSSFRRTLRAIIRGYGLGAQKEE